MMGQFLWWRKWRGGRWHRSWWGVWHRIPADDTRWAREYWPTHE